MLSSFLIGTLLAISPATTSLPIPPVNPPDYLEANLSPYTEKLITADPYTYPTSTPTTTKPIEQIIKEVFGKHSPVMLKIARCESGLIATATRKSLIEDSRGIFQVNIFAHSEVDPDLLYDPEYNIKYAKTLYDKEGLTPWSCRTMI